MNYIGSKKSLLDFIENTIIKYVPINSNMTFCDLFAGTGIVGRHFKDKMSVISNDVEYYSYILNSHYIGNNKYIECTNIFQHLNSLPLKEDGFIYQNYCLGSNSGRNYFSDYNGMKIDTIRQEIEVLFNKCDISKEEYFFLLASLIESSDKVANTASVYGAFLKSLKKTAKEDLILNPCECILSNYESVVYNNNANDIVYSIEGDILYLDPPYNTRQYSANYHLLNTIAKYDTFIPKGITGLRPYYKSNYSSKQSAKNSLEDLIKNVRFPYIFISYNNEGIISLDEMSQIGKKYGKYYYEIMDHKRFKSNNVDATQSTKEYIHIIIKE